MTFTEITARKGWEQEIQAAKEFAESIVATVREPLLVLTADLRVRAANDPSIGPSGSPPREPRAA